MGYSINTLADVAPILIKEGVMALRENSIMARKCLFDVKNELAQRGAVVNVEIPNAIPAQEVNVSSANAPTPLVPTVVPVTLDYWYEAKFSMSDKDMGEVKSGLLPASASEAIKSLANLVDTTGLALYKDIYGSFGVAGTDVDALSDLSGAFGVMAEQLAPISDPWTMLLNVPSYTNLQPLLATTEKYGDSVALQRGALAPAMNFDPHLDQNMPTHTAGALTAGTSVAAKTTYAIGIKTVVLDDSGGVSLTGSLNVGDLLTFAGDTQTYVITEAATASGNEITAKIEPGLKVALSDGVVATLKASHSVNLGFHPLAFCFASRPLSDQSPSSIIETMVDEISGITLRLEISRENKQTVWAYDILWGWKTIRKEFAVRLIGGGA